MRDVIFTIGYERAAVPDFLSTLAEARVGVVADVRAIAHSRRPGFAKTALGLHLVGAGIDYWHLPALGNPKPGREAAWAGDDALFRAIFQAHLRTSVAVEALGQLASRAADERICLLCLEAEPERCHRSLVATALQAAHGIGGSPRSVLPPAASRDPSGNSHELGSILAIQELAKCLIAKGRRSHDPGTMTVRIRNIVSLAPESLHFGTRRSE